MKFRFVVLFINFILCCFLSGNSNAQSNDLRLVSLAPNLTEIIYALGLGKNLVGDTIQCDYPAEAKKINKVGDYINPNLEQILSLKPNIVLATMGNPKALLNKLELFGIQVVEVEDSKSLAQLPLMIEGIASKLHAGNQGKNLSKRISNSLFILSQHKENGKKFLFVLQHNPLYSLSDNTWIGNLFSLAGYTNVVGKSRINYPIVSQEYLILNTPEYIFTSANSHLTLEENKKIEVMELNKIFLPEQVKNMKIIFLPKDIFVRPGPRVVDAIDFLMGSKIN